MQENIHNWLKHTKDPEKWATVFQARHLKNETQLASGRENFKKQITNLDEGSPGVRR